MTVADYNSFRRRGVQADTRVASDFYHRWREDIGLMKELGLKMYRFSISWARIIPDGDGAVNQEGIRFYHQVIDCLLKQGIKPFVTLYHFDLPYALVEKYNGWESRACVYAFERYAGIVFREYGDKAAFWQVHNEQNLMVRVDERMNLRAGDPWERDRMRAQIDPMGLRIVLNRYYRKYRLPLIVTENGLGAGDVLTEDGRVHDSCRIEYLRQHIRACSEAIRDGVELFGYSPWSFLDLLSSHQGFRKRYGFVYVNRDEHDLKDLARVRKDSFYWYRRVIETNGKDLDFMVE